MARAASHSFGLQAAFAAFASSGVPL